MPTAYGGPPLSGHCLAVGQGCATPGLAFFIFACNTSMTPQRVEVISVVCFSNFIIDVRTNRIVLEMNVWDMYLVMLLPWKDG